jgi:hypothetical protein
MHPSLRVLCASVEQLRIPADFISRYAAALGLAVEVRLRPAS